MSEEKIFVNGIKTNYKIAGHGNPLIILHGWNGSSDSWEKVIQFLSQNFLVICPDFPGFGKSQPPFFPWSLNDFVFWLKSFTELLRLESFFLLGHSFGGRVAIKFSIFFPEKIKKLILISSAGIKGKLDFKSKIIFQIAKIGNALFTPKILRRFKDGARNIFYLFLRNRDYAKAKGTMKETMKKVISEDLTKLLSEMKIETLLIWGERDKLVPPIYGKIFNEKIKNSKFILLSKIGHSPHLECPEKLAQIINQFFLF